MFLEFGFLWLPPLLWRLDALRDTLRAESPHASQLPSETIAEHVRFSIQPLDYVPEDRLGVEAVAACPELRRILCYASDYPHWDADEPQYVTGRLPREWKDDLFYGNAKSFFGERLPA
jgi:predicted TIM-barrel fold metal-dependent hydrolase